MIRVVQIVQPSVNLICACAAGRLKQFGRDLHLSSAGALSTSLCVTDTEVRDESMNASQAKGSQGRSTGDTTPQPTSETFRFAPQSGAKTQNKSVDALAPSSGLLTTRVSHHLVLKGFAVNIVLPHAADRTQTTSPIDAEDT